MSEILLGFGESVTSKTFVASIYGTEHVVGADKNNCNECGYCCDKVQDATRAQTERFNIDLVWTDQRNPEGGSDI